MLAYGILDESEELVLMTIEALIRLAAGNAGVNVANVGISSFAILTAVAHPIANSDLRIPNNMRIGIGTVSAGRF